MTDFAFGLDLLDLIIMGIGAFLLLIYLFFFLMGTKYNSIFEVLEEKEFPLKEIYGLGYAILELFKYKYKSKSDRVLRQQLDILYSDKYSEYYLRVMRTQQITISFTILILAFALYGFADDILVTVVCIVFAFLAFYYFGITAKEKISKRSSELLRDFSEVVSELALLTNTGMILREAWREVAEKGEGTIYTEMRTAISEMDNGVSESDAIFNFGNRCIIPEIKKFSSTIIQGLTKGNSELTVMLQEQSKEVWQLKKQLVRREGEKAASKLLIPICIMFVGILVMILIPIFTNLGV